MWSRAAPCRWGVRGALGRRRPSRTVRVATGGSDVVRRRALLAGLALALVPAALPAAPAAGADSRICTETLVRMSDGVRLHAWVSRLPPDGPRPVLFMMD